MALSYQNILYEKKEGIAIITYNRPQALNAMSSAMLLEVEDAITKAGDDPEVRAIIITATGRAFCVGGDVKEFQHATPQWIEQFNRRNLAVWRRMEHLRKPIIAAVNGYANIEAIQACDIVFASEDARLGLPEVNIGVCPGAGITIRLARWTSRFLAKEIVFSGEWLSAQEAHRMGIVNHMVPKEKLLDEAMAFARKLTKKAPLALGAAKMCVNVGSEMDLDQGMEYQLLESLRMFYTEDLKEGLRAFAEKREPRFQGK